MRFTIKSDTGLYIVNCVPEENEIHLAADQKKAAIYIKVDVDLIKGFAEDKIGCKFFLLDV
jgi:glycerol-3-phosphate responsive antiterminator